MNDNRRMTHELAVMVMEYTREIQSSAIRKRIMRSALAVCVTNNNDNICAHLIAFKDKLLYNALKQEITLKQKIMQCGFDDVEIHDNHKIYDDLHAHPELILIQDD